MASGELTLHEENSLLRIADGADNQDDVEEAAVSRLQSLALVEQRGVSFGLTLMGVGRWLSSTQLSVPRSCPGVLRRRCAACDTCSPYMPRSPTDARFAAMARTDSCRGR